MSPPSGYLALVLHAHLPFIRHPEDEFFLEEDWFFEGMVETYAPICMRLEKLRAEGIPFQITFTISPPLATMMEDELLRSRLAHYLNQRIELLGKELGQNRENHLSYLADHYLKEYTAARDFIFNRCGGRILNSFRSLSDSGHMEIITTTATHGFLPLMSRVSAQQAQVESAVRAHEYYFGKRPRGIWLAECGFDDGIDQILANAGLDYFFVDSHGVLFGDPQPVFGVYAPVVTESGVSVFARDPESSKQVWSSKEGYPGDANYREFYRDLGYDADYEYIKPYLHPDGVRRNLGIKYHRITGEVGLDQKQFYNPQHALEKAQQHAGNFMFNRQHQVQFLKDKTNQPPIIVSPYDAELFGHWWYEGPIFIEYLIRKMTFDQSEVKMTTCSNYLDEFPIRQLQKPNPSTWGSEGYNLVWLNGGNASLYRHQHWAEVKMEELAQKYPDADGDLKRALNQCLRELLLLQSSDWAFIMTTGTVVPYATRRFREHLDRFRNISNQIEGNRIDLGLLEWLESVDYIFPTADYRDVIPKENKPALV